MLPIAHIEKDCWLRWRVTKCFAVVLTYPHRTAHIGVGPICEEWVWISRIFYRLIQHPWCLYRDLSIDGVSHLISEASEVIRTI